MRHGTKVLKIAMSKLMLNDKFQAETFILRKVLINSYLNRAEILKEKYFE
jgi:hypothetical protein